MIIRTVAELQFLSPIYHYLLVIWHSIDTWLFKHTERQVIAIGVYSLGVGSQSEEVIPRKIQHAARTTSGKYDAQQCNETNNHANVTLYLNMSGIQIAILAL